MVLSICDCFMGLICNLCVYKGLQSHSYVLLHVNLHAHVTDMNFCPADWAPDCTGEVRRSVVKQKQYETLCTRLCGVSV